MYILRNRRNSSRNVAAVITITSNGVVAVVVVVVVFIVVNCCYFDFSQIHKTRGLAFDMAPFKMTKSFCPISSLNVINGASAIVFCPTKESVEIKIKATISLFSRNGEINPFIPIVLESVQSPSRIHQ